MSYTGKGTCRLELHRQVSANWSHSCRYLQTGATQALCSGIARWCMSRLQILRIHKCWQMLTCSGLRAAYLKPQVCPGLTAERPAMDIALPNRLVLHVLLQFEP